MSGFAEPFSTLRLRGRRLRRWAGRSPLPYWTAVVALATATAFAANAAAPPTAHDVLVVSRNVDAGELIGDAVQHRAVPHEVLPDDAVREIDANARANVALRAGDIVVERHLTTASSALAAKLGPDRSAVDVAGAATSPVEVGDLVDLYGLDSTGRVVELVDGAEVVALDESITVAVPHADTAAVIEARLASTLTIAVSQR